MYYIFNVTEQYNYLEIQSFDNYESAINGLLLMVRDYPDEDFILVKSLFKNY